jgi:hypothetical protein
MLEHQKNQINQKYFVQQDFIILKIFNIFTTNDSNNNNNNNNNNKNNNRLLVVK